MNSEVVCGDALEVLRGLPEESVQMCVTSPPYFGLRDYGVGEQIGLEATVEEYIGKLVAVFGEVRRVLRADGTLWVNEGDSYARQEGKEPAQSKWLIEGASDRQGAGNVSRMRSEALGSSDGFVGRADRAPVRVGGSALKPKDLCGIPWKLAFALQAAGWYLRQDIIWAKPNPMPESVRDRCTRSHEYIFLLSRSERYCYDALAIAEPCVAGGSISQKDRLRWVAQTGGAVTGGTGDKASTLATRNKRDVWWITPQPFRGAHFAVFPEELVRNCVLAGSKAGDLVLDPFCGSGTTGVVAKKLGRGFLGIDLKPEYCQMARERISGLPPPAPEVY